jgi:hypothetical protein
MTCPNCSSSKVRRATRSLAEKIFLPLLMTRPYRCEDCIKRFHSFLWRRTSAIAAGDADGKSLVYRSATAALHSEARHSRKGRRYRSAKQAHLMPAENSASYSGSSLAPLSSPRAVAGWLKKPIYSPKGLPPIGGKAVVPTEAEANSFPEILGVILEMKHEHSRV